MLYGLIHARFVLTSRGMAAMAEKYNNQQFGRCPRVLCHGQPVLPVGRSDLPRNYTVNVYCPMCQDIYHPKSSRAASIDGAHITGFSRSRWKSEDLSCSLTQGRRVSGGLSPSFFFFFFGGGGDVMGII